MHCISFIYFVKNIKAILSLSNEKIVLTERLEDIAWYIKELIWICVCLMKDYLIEGKKKKLFAVQKRCYIKEKVINYITSSSQIWFISKMKDVYFLITSDKMTLADHVMSVK